MVSEVKYQIMSWSMQMQKLICDSFGEMNPQMYSIGAVFIICVGFVMLKGQR